MGTLRNEFERTRLVERINSLNGSETPKWGKMTLEQMLSHLIQAGELPFEATVPEQSTFFSRTIIKPLIVHVLPMPKEVKVSAELDQKESGREPQGIEADRQALIEVTDRLGTLHENHKCLNHPFFGPMTASQWAKIAHKHMDHHLRQFGV